jgi:excisionase family DNA binding protein
MDSKKFLSPNELINLLGISYPSLLRLVKANKIPVIRIGKSLRFPKAFFDQIEREAISQVKTKED